MISFFLFNLHQAIKILIIIKDPGNFSATSHLNLFVLCMSFRLEHSYFNTLQIIFCQSMVELRLPWNLPVGPAVQIRAGAANSGAKITQIIQSCDNSSN